MFRHACRPTPGGRSRSGPVLPARVKTLTLKERVSSFSGLWFKQGERLFRLARKGGSELDLLKLNHLSCSVTYPDLRVC